MKGKTKDQDIHGHCLFQISYKQTPSIVVYLVAKQHRICRVHIGVWMHHSVYITHTYTHMHTPTCMKAHIYKQYNSHHAVIQTDSGVWTQCYFSLSPLHAPTEMKLILIFLIWIFHKTWQKHSQLLLKCQTERRGCPCYFSTYCKVVLFSSLCPGTSFKLKWIFETDLNRSSCWHQTL